MQNEPKCVIPRNCNPRRASKLILTLQIYKLFPTPPNFSM